MILICKTKQIKYKLEQLRIQDHDLCVLQALQCDIKQINRQFFCILSL